MIALLLCGALALLLVSLALAPIEALGWWAGWFGDERELEREALALRQGAAGAGSAASRYVVFLSGVGSTRSGELPAEERPFIAYLREHLPDCVVIDEVLPYSVLNRSLEDPRRPLSPLWRWLMTLGGHWQQVINTRNLLQVLVSADRRYGPVMNYGVARQILLALRRHGYVLGSGAPVTLIGSSGGGQMGLGAGPFLAHALRAPISMVSLGGVMSGDRAILRFTHVEHIYGSNDPVATRVPLLFPGRWPFNPLSPWQGARARGVYTERVIGPMAHTGSGGYYDAASRLPDGTDYCTHSAREVIACIHSWDGQEHRTASAPV